MIVQKPKGFFSALVDDAIDEVKGSVSDVAVSMNQVLNAFKIDEDELDDFLVDVAVAGDELTRRTMRRSNSTVQTYRIYKRGR
eukprot:CAMPEP_0197255006 /NCGR_PEP_ID=MMETSP1429-20130617/70722_1 /TAXON_ID=49237 /ORGANISM="Chaetoceros  sp., Strain UNC1202" /LENGTH=82 /DNA_ID=CAMNT_0042718163 /DNA_START=18 /DNA_END=266 /DNA_ORIENTATION=-